MHRVQIATIAATLYSNFEHAAEKSLEMLHGIVPEAASIGGSVKHCLHLRERLCHAATGERSTAAIAAKEPGTYQACFPGALCVLLLENRLKDEVFQLESTF